MELGRLTSKGQLTVPRRIRRAARLEAGDVVIFSVEEEQVTIRKLRPAADAYFGGVEDSLGEWLSPEDEEAWRDL